ncbi:MAG: DUF3084 domain-containing protein [Limnochordia bacterium]
MYGFTLIFILAFIGGVIAYIGDKIGMKVGRKRLTLFGLRPKYTGIVITIVTGIFISLASIIILAIASDDVRTALFRMKEIQETLAVNQRQLEQSITAMAEMRDDLDKLIAERNSASAELLETQSQLDQVRTQYQELEQKKVELETAIKEAETQIEMLREFNQIAVGFAEWIQYGDMIFHADQIVHAAVVESSPDINQIYAQLDSILDEADAKAYAFGARTEDSESAILLNPDRKDLAASMIHQGQGLFVVRVLSAANTVVGQPVVGELQIIPNTIIFQDGAVLSEITVDLNRAADVVNVGQKIAYLLNQASALAGMRGALTSDDGGAVEVKLGEISNCIDRIRELAEMEDKPQQVRIQAKAIGDTWAVDGPVNIRLEIVHE